MPISSKKQLKLAIPKSDLKAERKARQRASTALRKANREESLRLDGYQCRNPFCTCSQTFTIECAIIESHHILGKTRDNRYDGVKYRISLSQRCHKKYDKDRVGMLKILKHLKKTALDYRWEPSMEELERKSDAQLYRTRQN